MPDQLKAEIVTTPQGRFVTIYQEGGKINVVPSTHPNFAKIITGIAEGDASVLELCDIELSVGNRLQELTERVKTGNGRLYFDGDEMDNALSRQILRFLREGVEDWKPLVKYLEKVMTNPSVNSREQAYGFIEKNAITITEDGDIVCYKGVQRCPCENAFGATWQSVNGGTAFVNGEVVQGRIPNPIGSVISMPRSEVVEDPFAPCHKGLHVATRNFADSYGDGNVLEVHVNPRDIVSVPYNHADKMRVCRYIVADVSEREHTTPVLILDVTNDSNPVSDDALDSDDDGEYVELECCDNCGDEVTRCDCDEYCDYCEHLHTECICGTDTEPIRGNEEEEEEAKDEDTKDDIEPAPEPIKEPSPYTCPSPQKFTALRAEARLRKRGLERLLAKKGYTFHGGDPKNRYNWEIPEDV